MSSLSPTIPVFTQNYELNLTYNDIGVKLLCKELDSLEIILKDIVRNRHALILLKPLDTVLFKNFL